MDEKENRSTERRRLWIVTEFLDAETRADEYDLKNIAESLAEAFAVGVICRKTKPARGSALPDGKLFRHVKTIYSFGMWRPPVFDLFPSGVCAKFVSGLSIFFKGLKYFRAGDRILISAPDFSRAAAALSALCCGAAYTLMIRDDGRKNKYHSGIKNQTHVQMSATERFFRRWVFKYARKIIVSDPGVKNLLSEETMGLDIPLVIIPNRVEDENFEIMKNSGQGGVGRQKKHPAANYLQRLVEELR